jgi:hypothetical protein
MLYRKLVYLRFAASLQVSIAHRTALCSRGQSFGTVDAPTRIGYRSVLMSPFESVDRHTVFIHPQSNLKKFICSNYSTKQERTINKSLVCRSRLARALRGLTGIVWTMPRQVSGIRSSSGELDKSNFIVVAARDLVKGSSRAFSFHCVFFPQNVAPILRK